MEKIHEELNKEFLLEVLKYARGRSFLSETTLLAKSILPSLAAKDQLDKLTAYGLLSRDGELLRMSPAQKVNMAVQTLRRGILPNSVCRYLTWQEFEMVTSYALKKNGYHVLTHVKIKVNRKLSEIDLFAFQNRLALMVDCKHWRTHLTMSKIQEIASTQLRRLKALPSHGNLERIAAKLGRKLPAHLRAIPVVVTLLEATYLVCQGVPIVPVSKLAGFLGEVLGYSDVFSFQTLT